MESNHHSHRRRIYSPLSSPLHSLPEKLVCVDGFEPPASCSQSKRSTKLNYTQLIFNCIQCISPCNFFVYFNILNCKNPPRTIFHQKLSAIRVIGMIPQVVIDDKLVGGFAEVEVMMKGPSSINKI